MSHTPGEWKVFIMVNAEKGNEPMTPEDMGEYVKNAMLVNSDNKDFLFVSVTKSDGKDYDVCHIGNGPDGPANARLIAESPKMLELLIKVEAGGGFLENQDWQEISRLIARIKGQ